MMLSDEQQYIVDTWTTDGGAMLVSASAGSGKTRVLSESVRRLLDFSPKEKFRILCLTFTNKAAEEMQDRLKIVKGIKGRAFINTIHAFGLDVIKAYRHELGYIDMPHIVEKDADRKDILKKVFLQSPILEPYFMHLAENSQENSLEVHQKKILTNSLVWISNQKKKLIFLDDDATEYNGWKQEHFHLYKLYSQHLRNQNLIEFDDILLLAWKLLSIPSVASIYQRLYRYVLVDEAQDLNFTQYQIIKVLCGENIRNILMVGDANQAIHGYAGASKEYMFTEFVLDFSAKQAKIEKNYRSSQTVLNIANTIIKSTLNDSKNQFFKGIGEIHSFANENEEAQWIVNKITKLLNLNSGEFDGSVTLDKIAVLARNRFVFSSLINVLDNSILSSRYLLKKGTDSLQPESILMKFFDLGMRVICNPKGDVYQRQLLSLARLDFTKNKHTTGLEFLKKQKLSIYPQLINAWEAIDKSHSNFPKALDMLLENQSEIDDKEREYAQKDIEEWRAAWKKYITNTPPNTRTLADFRRYTVMGFNKTHSTTEQLTLATVHTSKGLEFDIVFLMGMTEGTFPDYRAKTQQALDEEKNNAYVAVTRAKRHIYITYPRQKRMPWDADHVQKKSRFICKLYESKHE
ncbi:ATP-dependent helicase [Candidatus Venteria ishoeyi]|uniref:ATP-dependent helicase n=1 Tax=Candidatus Venteria ishoeyi TaxID=1899563 RepID=UPI0025A4DFA1|nr:ATP-dependent helicase [Candidatus Venteria ishoeyi]MDM8546184.1 ATP-dependent helicase [Candidatus Venteria ishoeyi]